MGVEIFGGGVEHSIQLVNYNIVKLMAFTMSFERVKKLHTL